MHLLKESSIFNIQNLIKVMPSGYPFAYYELDQKGKKTALLGLPRVKLN